MRVILVIVSLLCINCNSIGSLETIDPHYGIINTTLEIYRTEYLNEDEKLKPIRINPIFSGLISTPSSYSDIQMFKDISLYKKERKNCDDFLVPKFEVDIYLNSYEEQFAFVGKEIDFKKIKANFISYNTKLEDLHNIKSFESFHSTDPRRSQEELKENYRKQLLHKENGHLEISYPIISYNKREAVLRIGSHRIGYELWFFEKVNEKWKKQCFIKVGSIN